MHIRLLILASFIFLCSCQEQSNQPQSETALLPVSAATYDEISREVGCDSKYIDEKKSDLFNARYKSHWMIWEGKVLDADPESVLLDINGQGTHELQAVFADKNGGYDILIGNTVSIRFVMRSQGGCILAFSGDNASIVSK